MNTDVVIVSAVRTPFDKFGGLMKEMSTVELGSIVLKESIERVKVSPEDIDEVYLGINMPTHNRSIARQAALKAGLPEKCNALTVDRACCSSMSAVAMGYRAIKLEEATIVICGGSENMSNVPYFINDLRWGKRMGDVVLKDIMVVSCPYTGVPRVIQAGNGASKYNISREAQDKWALRSHQNYFKADAAGKFDIEIIPIKLAGKKGKEIVIDKDQSPRSDTTLEILGKLPTLYNNPSVTAGNAPGMNTGAVAVLMMSKKEAKKRNLTPLATIIAHSQVSGHPDAITSIPAFAAKKVLQKAKMSIDQIDLIEINEAFAAMPLISTKILGDEVPEKVESIRAKTNINGGAIAIGHPTGASAARLITTLCYELRRSGGGYGLVSLCGGIGEGESIILKVDA